MNIFKIFLFIVVLVVIFFFCGGSVVFIVLILIVNIDNLFLKVVLFIEIEIKIWVVVDLLSDIIFGMSVDKVYIEILKGRKNSKVFVVVIDSGIDIEYEDLKDIIWVNEDEIVGNGIDDDKNGYVDDIYGWNFFGNIVEENMEYVWYIKKLELKFKGKIEVFISVVDCGDFEIYKRVKVEYEKEFGEI